MNDADLPEQDAALEDRLGEAALAAVMGDPYEVGLRIALDDGVAEALPVVARELAWIDAAVATTAGRLAGLAPADMPVGVPVAAGVGLAAEPTEPAAGFAVGPRPGLAVSRGQVRAAPVDLVAAAERAAAPLAFAEIGPVAASRAAEVSLAAPVAALRAADVSLAAPVAAGAVGRLDWGGTDWGRLAAVPGLAASAMMPAVAPDVAGPVDVPSAAPMWMDVAPVLSFGAGPSAAPVAMAAGETLRETGREAVRWGSAMAAPDTAQAAPGEDAETALEGRLEVDGALLGRFVAEMLGREAGRPPSGMTGFDPSVSPAWAGALQG